MKEFKVAFKMVKKGQKQAKWTYFGTFDRKKRRKN